MGNILEERISHLHRAGRLKSRTDPKSLKREITGDTFGWVAGKYGKESNLVTVQQDATYLVYCISVGSSTCSGCRHPSLGARTTVITASGID